MSKIKLGKIKNAIMGDRDTCALSAFRIESEGNKKFTVFGCIGIEEYGPSRISLYVCGGRVAFEGNMLLCDSYTNVGTVISGYVERVSFCLSGGRK